MSKTIYYLGAGASYGKRDNNGAILEGVPVVAEIPKEYEAFKDFAIRYSSRSTYGTYSSYI